MKNPKNWSDLPDDLLVPIARKLEIIKDRVAFRSVCVSWRAAVARDHFNRMQQFPFLLQTRKAGNVNKGQMFDFFQGKLYGSPILPDNVETYSLGWKGWVLAKEKNGNLYLFHVFHQTRIGLPSISSLQDFENEDISVYKAALSSNPFTNSSDYTLVIVCLLSKVVRFAFWRPRDKSYSKMETRSCIHDVTFHNDLCHAITSYGEVMTIDVSGHEPITTSEIPCGIRVTLSLMEYNFLMELGGDLLRVVQTFSDFKGNKPPKFQVFRYLDSREWRDFKNLGEGAIFIGRNTSFVVDSASKMKGCKPNRIYFTDDQDRKGRLSKKSNKHQIGVYNLKHRTVEYTPCSGDVSCRCSHPLLWVQPS